MKLNKRGYFVLGFVCALAFLGMWQVVTHLYWVGDHYCWGTFESCYR